MADKPKSAAKPAAKPAAPAKPAIEGIILTAIGLFVLLFLIVIPTVLGAFNVDTSGFVNWSGFKELLITVIAKIFTTITFISVFLILLLTLLLIYIHNKKKTIVENWKGTLSVKTIGQTVPITPIIGTTAPGLPGAMPAEVHGPMAEAGNEQWLDVEAKINSVNPSDWRLAILEADILLDDMVKQMGLPGDSLGERLKAADASFFGTLEAAWSAHKIRNNIAHQGTAYDLSYSEARRAIDLYRRVFEEFYFI